MTRGTVADVDDTSARLDRPRGIIFDLDGTLADTLPVCFDAYRLAFTKYVAHAWTDDQISALFGPSEEGVIRQVVPTRVEECLEDYLRHYDRCHERCQRPFAGIEALLVRLRRGRRPLALVTGKGPRSTRISLRRLDLAHAFDQVEVGSPAGGIKAESIRRVVTRWTLDASQVAYVGDSPHDVEAAREAGVVSIAAAWADAASIPKLREAEPDALFTSVETLSEWLGE